MRTSSQKYIRRRRHCYITIDINCITMADKRFNTIHKRKSDMLYICCQTPKFRKQLLRHADPELVRCMGQCATKVLDGTLPITSAEKTKLAKV